MDIYCLIQNNLTKNLKKKIIKKYNWRNIIFFSINNLRNDELNVQEKH